MFETKSPETTTRPAMCPYCQGRRIDTLAKVISPATCWRCRECDKTWTMANSPDSRRVSRGPGGAGIH